MSEDFYRYVRGLSDEMPAGYKPEGMRAYRYLVYLGASQSVEARFPDLRATLGEDDWRTLIEAFVKQSAWDSHYFGDLPDAFVAYLGTLNGAETG